VPTLSGGAVEAGGGMIKVSNEKVANIVAGIASRFPCFGVGSGSAFGNPISEALKNNPPTFAAGVDVETVVRFVVQNLKDIK